MNLTIDDIRQLTECVWDSVLRTPATLEAEAVWHRPRAQGIAAFLQVGGAWNGGIMLDCSEPAARKIAATMFMTDGARITLPDMQDAVAELANMIAGGVKGLSPEGCTLSLPRIVDPSDAFVRAPRSSVGHYLRFKSDGDVFSVTVF